jgi:hypothetical protein
LLFGLSCGEALGLGWEWFAEFVVVVELVNGIVDGPAAVVVVDDGHQ